MFKLLHNVMSFPLFPAHVNIVLLMVFQYYINRKHNNYVNINVGFCSHVTGWGVIQTSDMPVMNDKRGQIGDDIYTRTDYIVSKYIRTSV